MTTTDTTFDTTALTVAIEGRDAAGQLAAYAPDAELVIVDHDHTPSHPLVLRGRDAIGAQLADVCARDMTHSVRTAVAGAGHIAYEVACTYPDGTRVSCLCIAEVTDGLIRRQQQLQVWDH